MKAMQVTDSSCPDLSASNDMQASSASTCLSTTQRPSRWIVLVVAAIALFGASYCLIDAESGMFRVEIDHEKEDSVVAGSGTASIIDSKSAISNLTSTTTTTTTNATGLLFDSNDGGERASGSKVVLVTIVFSSSAARKRFLRMFLESAATSGIDILVLGDPVPLFELPGDNIRHHQITWGDFLTLASEKIFDGRPVLDPLKHTHSFYKVVDFKPLLGVMFGDTLLKQYEFWGHCDNDMLLGDVKQVLPLEQLLQQNDIISGGGDLLSYGPFTLFRNTPLVNELFRKSEIDLEFIFNHTEAVSFTEKGNLGPWMNKVASMSPIIEKYGPDMGIRTFRINQRLIVNDGKCKGDAMNYPAGGRCAECLFDRRWNNNKSHSVLVHRWGNGHEQPVLLCHYRTQKKKLEDSLQHKDNGGMFHQLLDDHSFLVNIRDGFGRLAGNKNWTRR